MQEIWTISSLLNWTKQYFARKGVENPRLDAEVLLSFVLDTERIQLYVRFDQPLEEDELVRFREAVRLRAERMPVAYITGRKEFMGLTFRVTPDVLIPRPETEFLVEAALQRLLDVESPRILDIGTGSGAILVSLLVKRPDATGVAIDLSEKALAVAAQNARTLGVESRFTALQSNLFASLQSQLFSTILSNPPYITRDEMTALSPEVAKEPLGALDGGPDGLDFYRRLTAEGKAFLSPGGFMAMEVGMGQAETVAGMAKTAGWDSDVAIICDYAGIDRVVVVKA